MKKSAKKKQENAEVTPVPGEEIAVAPLDVGADSASKKSIGYALFTMREKKELSLDKVAVNLNISERYLQAIEQMEMDELPEKVYTLGFVRSYARYLGVDPQKSVDRFKKEMYDGQAPREILMPEPLKPIEKPKTALVVAATLIAFGVAALFYVYETPSNTKPMVHQEFHEPAKQEISQAAVNEVFNGAPFEAANQPVQDLASQTSNQDAAQSSAQAVAFEPAAQAMDQSTQATQPVPAPGEQVNTTGGNEISKQTIENKQSAEPVNLSADATQAADTPLVIKATPAQTSPSKLDKLVLTFNDKAWVSIKRSGTVLISKTFTPGESYSFPYSKDLSLSTHNTKAFNLSIEGKEYVLTDRGEKLENFALKDLDAPVPTFAPQEKVPTTISVVESVESQSEQSHD